MTENTCEGWCPALRPPTKQPRLTARKPYRHLLPVAFAEADAQVAFLATCGLASAVITEDSDILVYMAAAKCTASVLYKMDEFGNCKEMGFDAAKLSSLPGAMAQGADMRVKVNRSKPTGRAEREGANRNNSPPTDLEHVKN